MAETQKTTVTAVPEPEEKTSRIRTFFRNHPRTVKVGAALVAAAALGAGVGAKMSKAKASSDDSDESGNFDGSTAESTTDDVA